jgi:hypothetical protein
MKSRPAVAIVILLALAACTAATPRPTPPPAAPPPVSPVPASVAPAAATAATTATAATAATAAQPGAAAPAAAAPTDAETEQAIFLKKAHAHGYHAEQRKDQTVYCRAHAELGTRFESKECVSAQVLAENLRREDEMHEEMRHVGVCAGSACSGPASGK